MSCENLSGPVLGRSAAPSPLVLDFTSAFLLAPFSARRVFLRAALDRVRPGRAMSESSGIWPNGLNGSNPPGSWAWPYCAAAVRIRPSSGRIQGISTGKSHSTANENTPAHLRPRRGRMRAMMLTPVGRPEIHHPIPLFFLALRTLTRVAAAIRPVARPRSPSGPAPHGSQARVNEYTADTMDVTPAPRSCQPARRARPIRSATGDDGSPAATGRGERKKSLLVRQGARPLRAGRGSSRQRQPDSPAGGSSLRGDRKGPGS